VSVGAGALGAGDRVIELADAIGQVTFQLPHSREQESEAGLIALELMARASYDPRAAIIREMCHRLLQRLGRTDTPLFDLALRLEEIALKDDYFVSKNLYPNVDFYSGIIYRALGIPTSMFTVMFAIGRMPGWIAQWKEMHDMKPFKIGRPRQIYVGPSKRHYRQP